MALTFRGGIHHEEEILTGNLPLKEMPSPDFVTLPLSGHKEDAAKPLVSVGDRVLKGQKIADGEGNVAPIHASISGTVSAIGSFPTPSGEEECIVLQNDYKEELSPEVMPFDTPIGKAEPEALIRHIREKGIVGLGGTGFPTFAKLEEARGKATRLIVNCAECEPYLTGIHRLLLEKTEEVVGGVKNTADFDGESIVLTVKDTGNLELKKKTLDKWLTSVCRETVDSLISSVYPAFEIYGIPYPQIKYRRMKSMWGNCRAERGILTFNYALAHAPLPCIEYVVYHEFTHFLEPNHSARFYAGLDSFLPDWRERKRILESSIVLVR